MTEPKPRGFGVKRWIALMMSLALVLAACSPSDSEETSSTEASETTAPEGSESPDTTGPDEGSDDPTEVRIAMGIGAFEALDPQSAVSPPTNAITVAMYDRLVVVDDNNEIQPQLATSWERTDELTLVFQLRDDAVFADGTPVTTDAVAATFTRILDPANELTRASSFSGIDSVEAIDATTVQFNLNSPFPNVLFNLAYSGGAIINPAAIEAGVDLNSESAGSGPFVLEEIGTDGSVTLAANPNYWGEKTNVDRIIFMAVADEATRASMLQAGEADIIANLPVTLFDQIEGTDDLEVAIFPSNRVMHVGFNLGKSPLENILVRQALNYAVDKKAIVDTIIAGLGVPADSYLAPTVPGFVETDGYPYNPEKASELLAEAGVSLPLEITLRYPEGRYLGAKEVSEAVQAYLQAVGVNAELIPMEFNTLLDAFRLPNDGGNEFELYFLGFEAFTGEAGGVTQILMHSDAFAPDGWNTMFYSRDDVDQLIDDASVTVDVDARNALYGDVQRLVSEDPPWLFLYTASSAWGVNSRIGDMRVAPDDMLFAGLLSVSE